MSSINQEPMLELFVFETLQLVEQLEQEVLSSEKEQAFSKSSINQIFRIMHTIKSSAAMMLYKNISLLAHATEDLFYFIREENPTVIDGARLTDIILESIDYIKGEMVEIQEGKSADREASGLIEKVKTCLADFKQQNPEVKPMKEKQVMPAPQTYYIPSNKAGADSRKYYQATLFFEEGCEMENVRAFTVAHHLKELSGELQYVPEDIIANEATADTIKAQGFTLYFDSERSEEELMNFFAGTAFLNRLEFKQVKDNRNFPGKKQIILDEPAPDKLEKEPLQTIGQAQQSFISVNVVKLDMLMDIVGELVIAEAMVTQHPELAEAKLSGFYKAARQLKKISGELQDIVMSIRMVPLTPTFNKMNRIVRDACKSLGKDVTLQVVGAATEVDKNIIDHIADPLMHLIRNAIDHGIECPADRKAVGKAEQGEITLEAKNAGKDVWIIVKDDGRGLNRDKILKKAQENGLTAKNGNELSDQEIFSFIFLPGFSTKEQVTELSGRGVGMDVVAKNIEKIGGIVTVESKPGIGTTILIKIPLTLAIIDGMSIRVGDAQYTIPTISIRQSFRAKHKDIITDEEGQELILVRGECYPILRLHKIYGINTSVTNIDEGITILVESNGRGFCIFADELLGQQQVVVKALPTYIKKVKGLAGCTLLGGGSISLILDVDSFTQSYQ